MRLRYRADWKSGPHVQRREDDGRRFVHMAGVDHCTRWKRPVTKKTAAELLYQDDDRDGTNQDRLTREQRVTLEKRAGKQYTKRDPFEKRPTESVEAYVARINRLVG